MTVVLRRFRLYGATVDIENDKKKKINPKCTALFFINIINFYYLLKPKEYFHENLFLKTKIQNELRMSFLILFQAIVDIDL